MFEPSANFLFLDSKLTKQLSLFPFEEKHIVYISQYKLEISFLVNIYKRSGQLNFL